MRAWTRAAALAVALVSGAFLMAGCLTSNTISSEGIDLSERGELTLAITRVSASAIATVAATVEDAASLSTQIVLSDDQIVTVNEIPLVSTSDTILGLDATLTATIESVDAPDIYEIAFDNEGVVTSFKVTPPVDFDAATPESGTEVSRDGFDLAWELVDEEDAEEDDDVTLTIALTGTAYYYDDDLNLQSTEYTVMLDNLADDGEISIGSAELYPFVAGDITVTLVRQKLISQKLGFASGTFRLQVVREIELTLVEPEEDE